MPAHAINTIFERSTNRTVVLRADAHVSNRRRSMAVSVTCAATRIRRPPLSDAGSVNSARDATQPFIRDTTLVPDEFHGDWNYKLDPR